MTTKKTPDPQNPFAPAGDGEQPAPVKAAKGRDAVSAKLDELQGRLINLDDATRQDFARIIQEARDAL